MYRVCVLWFSHCCVSFPGVSMVINDCESRPLKDWCLFASDIFPRVSRPPLKFSETKLYCALLQGMERFHVCVRQYFCFFLYSCGLACLRNSVDHFGNWLFSAAFFLHLTFGISVLRWAHPEFMCSLGSNELDRPFVFFLEGFGAAEPIIANKQRIHRRTKTRKCCVNLLVGLVVMSQLSLDGGKCHSTKH